MSEITTVGLDLAKNVFQVHGADASGRTELRKKLRRDQVQAFFSQLQPCVVAMKACGGAGCAQHYLVDGLHGRPAGGWSSISVAELA